MVNPVALIGGINYEWMVDISVYYWVCGWLYVLWEGQLRNKKGRIVNSILPFYLHLNKKFKPHV